MARSRSLPTSLFWNLAFSRFDGETQSILLGLTLLADDEGRGHAHPALLARQFNKSASLIEQALAQLEHEGFLCCYEARGERYYQHLSWHHWQTLSKPTPSHIPPPPLVASPTERSAPVEDKQTRHPQAIPGLPREIPQEEEEEGEEKVERERATPTSTRTSGVLPHARLSERSATPSARTSLLEELAQVLCLEGSPLLHQLAQEQSALPRSVVLQEAQAARNWIDDPGRNWKGQVMTPAFFRRWMQRAGQDACSLRAVDASSTQKWTATPDPYARFVAVRRRAVQQATLALRQGERQEKGGCSYAEASAIHVGATPPPEQ